MQKIHIQAGDLLRNVTEKNAIFRARWATLAENAISVIGHQLPKTKYTPQTELLVKLPELRRWEIKKVSDGESVWTGLEKYV